MVSFSKITSGLLTVFMSMFLFSNIAVAQECTPTEADQLFRQTNSSGDWFGYSVDVSGQVMVVGSYEDDNGESSGGVYVYRYDGSTWAFETKLLASDGEAFDEFGVALAVKNDLIVVGAIGDDDFGSRSGAAYVYRNEGGSWVETEKITPSNAQSGMGFGRSVSIADDGLTILVSSMTMTINGTNTGAGHIFRFENGSWVEEQVLTPANGFLGDSFGFQADISGDGGTVIIGAIGANSAFGSAYIFRDNGTQWVEETELHASDAEFFGFFGYAVAIEQDTAVVSAINSGGNGFFRYLGASYVYRFDGTLWSEESKLIAPDAVDGDYYGASIALKESSLLIGASGKSAVYLYRNDGVSWNLDSTLIPNNTVAGDEFGSSVAISGDDSVVGAYLDGDGSAIIFDLGCSGEPCFADLNNNGTLNFFDISLFLSLFNDGDLSVDFNGNGTLNFFDISIFLTAFSKGCP